jgi:hypothetical protein
MNRQTVIVILIGALASLSGFATADYFMRRRCGELDGIWDAARECRLGSGEIAGTWTIVSVIAGAGVALAVGVTLYRAYLFATGRARALGTNQEG